MLQKEQDEMLFLAVAPSHEIFKKHQEYEQAQKEFSLDSLNLDNLTGSVNLICSLFVFFICMSSMMTFGMSILFTLFASVLLGPLSFNLGKQSVSKHIWKFLLRPFITKNEQLEYELKNRQQELKSLLKQKETKAFFAKLYTVLEKQQDIAGHQDEDKPSKKVFKKLSKIIEAYLEEDEKCFYEITEQLKTFKNDLVKELKKSIGVKAFIKEYLKHEPKLKIEMSKEIALLSETELFKKSSKYKV